MDALWALLGLSFVAGLALYIVYEQRQNERLKRLRPPNTVLAQPARIRVSSPSQPVKRWTRAHLFVTDKHIVAYARHGGDTPLFHCFAHEIEGFWRPVKYHDGINGIEIHADAGGQWKIAKIRLSKSRMMALVRALKGLVDEDIVRAYRQRRPYIYRPPAPAHLATQDIHGLWTYERAFRLYLTPSRLVFLSDDDRVERIIRLRDIQNIRVLKRADSDTDGGLVCFSLPDRGEDIALSVEEYEAWAQSIATAARRTLEEPIARKRKGKALDDLLDDDADWDNDAFDQSLWESQEYVLGDDGELEPRRSKTA
jgi:hypothetical protein